MADDRLARLEQIHAEFGGNFGVEKLGLLQQLAARTLTSAAEVRRLHEILCFLRACPDDHDIHVLVDELLLAFQHRPDLKRFKDQLRSTGIAGTDMEYPFFFPTACWLVDRWPQRLHVEWEEFSADEAFERLLPLLTTPSEMPLVDEFEYSTKEWVDLLRSPDETDAAFLIRSFRNLPMTQPAQEKLWDGMGSWMILDGNGQRPSRTLASHPVERMRWQRGPLNRKRPDLRQLAALRPKLVRAVSREEGQDLINLAQEAMVTRERDLDAFAYGDPGDVRIVECGEGLQFAAIGMVPERRLLLETVYGFLTLKNGVPIGYVLSSALFGSSEIAYNVFDTFRGGEAAHVYGKVVGMLHWLFGSDTFVVFPYQLGWHNDEGLASGAWWFYQKLGFRPKDAKCLQIMEGELARMKKNPEHRSSRATLEKLSEEPVYLHLGPERDDVIGQVSLGDIGRHVARFIGTRFGADRARGVKECARAASELLGVTPSTFWREGQVESFERWSPLALALPGIETWSAAERKALGTVMRMKGGRRESEYVRYFNGHDKLRAALLELARDAS